VLIPAPDPVHVLLVEDNPADADLVKDLLADLDTPAFSVHAVRQLSEARRALAEAEYHVVLSDLGLPDSQGLETILGLQTAAPQSPLVVFTGESHDAMGLESIQMGAQDFLPKDSLNEHLLGRTLRYAIERHRLEEEQRLWAKAFEASEPMMITGRDGTIQGVNSAFTAVTGYPGDEAVGANPRRLLRSDHHDDAFFAEIWGQIHREGHWSGEIWNRRRDGEVFPVHETITAVSGPSGEVSHYVAVLQDITERKRLEQELEELATHDRLTGALNRGRIGELLDHEIERSARYGTALAVILLDIDHFKHLNDTFGHPAGDAVLRELAQRLEGQMRSSDRLGRWGGEEFLVLLPETDEAGACQVAERLRRAVAERTFDMAGPVTVSLGVAERLPREDNTQLVERVDRALYHAKALGRDRAATAETESPTGADPREAHP
jgi:diguanylate cyclase (GGDEF)-like protein/PAS domain S-box-containing protein